MLYTSIGIHSLYTYTHTLLMVHEPVEEVGLALVPLRCRRRSCSLDQWDGRRQGVPVCTVTLYAIR